MADDHIFGKPAEIDAHVGGQYTPRRITKFRCIQWHVQFLTDNGETPFCGFCFEAWARKMFPMAKVEQERDDGA